MQTKTFDFKRDPFGQDFEPKFLYKSSSLNSMYQLVFEDIKTGDGIIVLSAEAGMGKTLLLQELKQNLKSTVRFFSPNAQNREFQSIVNGLCDYLALNIKGKDFFENILALDNYLNKVEQADSRIAIVLDDAHHFDDTLLKKLLMLSIPPSEERGSLQIILAGWPELETRIQKIQFPTETDPLKIRYYHLQKLTTLQVREYINIRLQAVASKRRNLFTPDAIADIALYSTGIPSLINKYCASTLSLVDKANEQTVTKDIVQKAAQTERDLLIAPIRDLSDSQTQKIPGELTTLEKFHLRMKEEETSSQEETPIQEKKLIENQVTEPKNESSDNSLKGYAWGIAATLLLLAGIFFYGPGTRFSDPNKNIPGGDLIAKSEQEKLEQSDQAMSEFTESAETEESLKNLKPLLMANKNNLFQKVLTLPGATLFQQPKASKLSAIPLPAFSVYYVYLRIRDNDLQEWLQVGMGRKGDMTGWIKANKVQDWNQGLTLAFKEPKNHDRVMLFKNKASLNKIVKNKDIETYQKLYKAASHGKTLKDSPVVAIQPTTGIDLDKNFYLLPIHDYEEIYMGNETARLLQVSSISRQEKPGNPPNKPLISGNHQAHIGSAGHYRAGITFVIDSTLSMQPFIDSTRKAVATIYDSLEQAKLLGKVNFGLVAFRDNTDVVPDIEYVTRHYVTLKQGKSPQTFMSAVNNLKAADNSSKDFIEDSYAGVNSALNNMDWTPYAARYIVLITDAGARGAKDPLSFSHLNAKRLNQMAQKHNAAIFVMHILTPDPQADHKAAAKQYLKLSNYPGIGNLYYAVPTASVKEFGQVIESLAKQITDQVAHINGGKKKTFIPNTKNKKLAALQLKVAKLGHALELKYLKNTKNEQTPAIFKAWVLDRDFKNPEKSVLEVRTLLTRDQLSDLHSILKQVLETAKQGQVSPKQFLNELKSLSATLMRDPKQLGDTTATTSGGGQSLAELGFLREYIEDLPYTGEIMGLALKDWQSWPAQKQEDFLTRLQDKIDYYQTIHDNVDLWISLEDKSIDGDAVYPMPLDKLP
jgi:type II secretory pathway predicted ATPase ExeA